MEVFLLGAGKPSKGLSPSALKKLTIDSNVLDWQVRSFSDLDNKGLHFIAGYHAEKVISKYPKLKYTVIPDWDKRTVLHTLLESPLPDSEILVTYADTIFRNDIITNLCNSPGDVVIGVDSVWLKRFQHRNEKDIAIAETIFLEDFDCGSGEVEFTGLISFKAHVVEFIRNLSEQEVGKSLIDLVCYLRDKNFNITIFDVQGNWAELNSPADISHFILGTKAETLSRLENVVKQSTIGEQICFTVGQWRASQKEVIESIKKDFNKKPLIVRSSAHGEDNWVSSNAGGFESILNIDSTSNTRIIEAIETVIKSYGTPEENSNQVLLQEFVKNISFAGVVFTCGLDTGSPYYRINFDEKNDSTASVTSGLQGDLRTVIVSRTSLNAVDKVDAKLIPVIKAISELEKILHYNKLDIEFAVDHDGLVYIFQVRPIVVDHSEYEISEKNVYESILESSSRFNELQEPSPFVLGKKTFFGNMPDWNPAEIIGVNPKNLAFSLYRYLITNEVWAAQRAEYGYRDVRPQPLLVSFSGHPFVDIRASFNSFIPVDLPDPIAEKLVNAYLAILEDKPYLHDKIEFEVAFTVWTPCFQDEAIKRLCPYGISEDEIKLLEESLKKITRASLIRLSTDISSLAQLSDRMIKIEQGKQSELDKLFCLLEDCKFLGTKAFSHAARAGFVASTLLRSFVKKGWISKERKLEFLRTIKTVTGIFEDDKYAVTTGQLSIDELVKRYGHLRPGTYEISNSAYWENNHKYLSSTTGNKVNKKSAFSFTEEELSKFNLFLKEVGGEHEHGHLIDFIIRAIQSREFAKFEFTKNLSKALDYTVKFGGQVGLPRENLAFLEYSDLEGLRLGTLSHKDLDSIISKRKLKYKINHLIELPSLITKDSDFYCFEKNSSQPNFVTMNRVESKIAHLEANVNMDIKGKIVLI
ncbi:MAG: hypothetical protein HRT87_05245, partial [Legionellales bacterium]|nr:hypothetical protein [Legionellales bacterium]